MIRILEEKVEKKKLYKYTTLKLRIPKDMELDMMWGHVDEIPKIVVENGIAEIVFKQRLKKSSDTQMSDLDTGVMKGVRKWKKRMR